MIKRIRVIHVKERFLRHFTLFDKVKLSKRQTNIERTYNDEINGKQVLFLGGIFIIAFAIWTALIQMVDVQPLGQNGTNIGFATFNCWFHPFDKCKYDNLDHYRLDGV